MEKNQALRMSKALTELETIGVKANGNSHMTFAAYRDAVSINPRDVPEIRLKIANEWRVGGPLERVAERLAPVTTGVDRLSPVWERRTIKNADLWYVSSDMIDLLQSVAEGLPDDCRMEDIPLLSNPEDLPSGLVILEKPLLGLDADDPDQSIVVGGFTFGPVYLNSLPHLGARGGHALAISTYSRIDLGMGIDESTMKSPTAMALMAEKASELEGAHTKPGKTVVWAPLGWSTWPCYQEIQEPIFDREVDGVKLDENRQKSLSEDRRWLAAMLVVAYQTKLSTLARTRLPRQERRPSERLGYSSDINIVRLREIKTPPPLDGVEGENDVEWSCRWVVQAHPCWQRYGPGNAYRKLIVRGPFIKGPAGLPLKQPKVTVKAIVR